MSASLAAAGPVRLDVPGRSLVLVAGLPGAGKSTLLASLPVAPALAVLDSQTQRAALAAGLPYRLVRPFVHLAHRAAVVVAAVFGPACVVVHLPATASGLRAAVRALARLSRRDAHLVWIDADPADALRGQHARGRTVRPEAFGRHVAAAAGLTERLRRGEAAGGWASVRVLDRTDTGRGLRVVTTPK